MARLTIETFPALPEKNYSDAQDDPALAGEWISAEPEATAGMCADPSVVEYEEFPAQPMASPVPAEALRQAHAWLRHFSPSGKGALGTKLWESQCGGLRVHLDLDQDLPCHVVRDSEENIFVQCDKN